MADCDTCYWQSDECLLGLEPDDDCPHYIDRIEPDEEDLGLAEMGLSDFASTLRAEDSRRGQ